MKTLNIFEFFFNDAVVMKTDFTTFVYLTELHFTQWKSIMKFFLKAVIEIEITCTWVIFYFQYILLVIFVADIVLTLWWLSACLENISVKPSL